MTTTTTTELTFHGILSSTATRPLVDETLVGQGTITRRFILPIGGIISSLYVRSIEGQLDINMYTFSGDGSDASAKLKVLSYDSIIKPSGELLLKEAGSLLSNIEIEISYSGTVDLLLFVRPRNVPSMLKEQLVAITGEGAGNTAEVDENNRLRIYDERVGNKVDGLQDTLNEILMHLEIMTGN